VILIFVSAMAEMNQLKDTLLLEQEAEAFFCVRRLHSLLSKEERDAAQEPLPADKITLPHQRPLTMPKHCHTTRRSMGCSLICSLLPPPRRSSSSQLLTADDLSPTLAFGLRGLVAQPGGPVLVYVERHPERRDVGVDALQNASCWGRFLVCLFSIKTRHNRPWLFAFCSRLDSINVCVCEFRVLHEKREALRPQSLCTFYIRMACAILSEC